MAASHLGRPRSTVSSPHNRTRHLRLLHRHSATQSTSVISRPSLPSPIHLPRYSTTTARVVTSRAPCPWAHPRLRPRSEIVHKRPVWRAMRRRWRGWKRRLMRGWGWAVVFPRRLKRNPPTEQWTWHLALLRNTMTIGPGSGTIAPSTRALPDVRTNFLSPCDTLQSACCSSRICGYFFPAFHTTDYMLCLTGVLAAPVLSSRLLRFWRSGKREHEAIPLCIHFFNFMDPIDAGCHGPNLALHIFLTKDNLLTTNLRHGRISAPRITHFSIISSEMSVMATAYAEEFRNFGTYGNFFARCMAVTTRYPFSEPFTSRFSAMMMR